MERSAILREGLDYLFMGGKTSFSGVFIHGIMHTGLLAKTGRPVGEGGRPAGGEQLAGEGERTVSEDERLLDRIMS